MPSTPAPASRGRQLGRLLLLYPPLPSRLTRQRTTARHHVGDDGVTDRAHTPADSSGPARPAPISSRRRSRGSRCTTQSPSMSDSTVFLSSVSGGWLCPTTPNLPLRLQLYLRDLCCPPDTPLIPPALYPLLYYAYYHRYDDFIKSEEWTFIYCVLLFGGHALSFLVTAWSASIRARISFTTVRTAVGRGLGASLDPLDSLRLTRHRPVRSRRRRWSASDPKREEARGRSCPSKARWWVRAQLARRPAPC